MNVKERGASKIVVLMVLVALGASCSRSSRQTVTLAGSTAFQPFAEKLAELYLAVHPGEKINVQGGGSAVGVQSALSGAAQIGMADLLTLPEEAKALTSTVVARDGIAIIVHPTNAIAGLTAAQAKAVFSGKISNWKDVGGKDTAIRVISREEGSGTRSSFDALVLGTEKLVTGALFQNSNGTVREAVASDSSSIGYISHGLLSDRVKALTYENAAPTNTNVKNDTYPLARPVLFLTKGTLAGPAQAFIDYVLGPEGQALLEKEGLIAAK